MSGSTIFISYSRRDEPEKEALLSHLGILQRQGLLELWSEDRIEAGSDWQQEIRQAIGQARVAVLLISVNYLNSEFIVGQQIPLLLNRSQSEGLIVFPVIAKACAWRKIDWLVKMRVRPGHENPIWREGGIYVDDELAEIATEIADIIAEKASDRVESLEKEETFPLIPPPSPSSSAHESQVRYHSCFICYSSDDEAFAEQLHADLRQRGVACWFAPEDMKIGAKIRPTIDRSIHSHDKLLLILSENSIHSGWVETEVETALEKEQRHGELVLFPIRLDQTVLETDQAWAATIRRTRHIGDFSRWTNHDAYQRAFKRLLRDLKAEG